MAGVDLFQAKGDQARQAYPRLENDVAVIGQPAEGAPGGLLAASHLAGDRQKRGVAAAGIFVVMIGQAEENGFRPTRDFKWPAPLNCRVAHDWSPIVHNGAVEKGPSVGHIDLWVPEHPLD